MNSVFKLCKIGNNSIGITGLEVDSHEYSDVLVNRPGVFRYEDTVTINILKQLDSNQNIITMEYDINDHTSEDYSLMNFSGDGVFSIEHIIIPTMKWYESCSDLEYDEIYVYEDKQIFKLENDQFVPFTIQDLSYINKCLNTTITWGIQYTFNTSSLQDCYYKMCRDYFDNLYYNECYHNSIHVRNRDIVWMSINIIRYLLDLGRLFEAQMILEKIQGCTGLCNLQSKQKFTYEGCGCQK